MVNISNNEDPLPTVAVNYTLFRYNYANKVKIKRKAFLVNILHGNQNTVAKDKGNFVRKHFNNV